VDPREVEELALQHHADVFEVSAKTGENVNELFLKIARDFLKSKASGSGSRSQPILDIRPAPVGQRPIGLGPFPKISDINAKDEHGDTPLHRAARLGDSDRIKSLLDHGANATITTVRARLHHSSHTPRSPTATLTLMSLIHQSFWNGFKTAAAVASSPEIRQLINRHGATLEVSTHPAHPR